MRFLWVTLAAALLLASVASARHTASSRHATLKKRLQPRAHSHHHHHHHGDEYHPYRTVQLFQSREHLSFSLDSCPDTAAIADLEKQLARDVFSVQLALKIVDHEECASKSFADKIRTDRADPTTTRAGKARTEWWNFFTWPKFVAYGKFLMTSGCYTVAPEGSSGRSDRERVPKTLPPMRSRLDVSAFPAEVRDDVLNILYKESLSATDQRRAIEDVLVEVRKRVQMHYFYLIYCSTKDALEKANGRNFFATAFTMGSDSWSSDLDATVTSNMGVEMYRGIDAKFASVQSGLIASVVLHTDRMSVLDNAVYCADSSMLLSPEQITKFVQHSACYQAIPIKTSKSRLVPRLELYNAASPEDKQGVVVQHIAALTQLVDTGGLGNEWLKSTIEAHPSISTDKATQFIGLMSTFATDRAKGYVGLAQDLQTNRWINPGSSSRPTEQNCVNEWRQATLVASKAEESYFSFSSLYDVVLNQQAWGKFEEDSDTSAFEEATGPFPAVHWRQYVDSGIESAGMALHAVHDGLGKEVPKYIARVLFSMTKLVDKLGGEAKAAAQVAASVMQKQVAFFNAKPRQLKQAQHTANMLRHCFMSPSMDGTGVLPAAGETPSYCPTSAALNTATDWPAVKTSLGFDTKSVEDVLKVWGGALATLAAADSI